MEVLVPFAVQHAAAPAVSVARRMLLLGPRAEAQALKATLLGRGAPIAVHVTDAADEARAALARGEWDLVAALWPSAAAEAIDTMPEGLPRVLIVEEPSDEALRAAQRTCAVLVKRARCAEQLADVLASRARTYRRASFDAEQLRILELVATGAPLELALERIVLLIEAHSGGICSILLLDADSATVRHGAAPNLPSEFVRAIDGSTIGPHEGSCGAAAFTGVSVVVTDIARHANWEKYRQLALPHGLLACWSTPIVSPEREVLGTFAVYYREPRGPSDDEQERVASATHLAALAIMRERHERALRESEQRQRQLLETSYEGVLILDLEGRITFANERASEMLRASTERLLGHSFFDLVHPSERERVYGVLAARRSGRSEQYELRLRTHDHQDLWTIVAASPVLGPAGEVVATLKMLTDISKRKRVEQALARSELELRSIFESTRIGIALVDADAVPLRFNAALSRMLGYEEDELKRTSLLALVHADDLEAVGVQRSALNEGARTHAQLTLRMVRKDGSVVWVRAHSSRFEQAPGRQPNGVVLLEDISESKRLEEALRAEERLLALIFHSVDEAICYLQVEPGERYRYLSVNRALCQVLAKQPHELVGKLVNELLPASLMESLLRRYRQAIAERRTLRWEDVGHLPHGTEYAEVSATPVFNGETCTNLIITARLITEQKRAAAQIAEQAALLDRARDAIVLYAFDDRVVRYWNESAAQLYGHDRDAATGMKVDDLLPCDPAIMEAAEQRLLETGAFFGELPQRTRRGDTIVVDSSWTLLRDASGHPESVLVINTDATERKRLNEQVMLAQRMESLGTLAGGIAHDFNNILAAIRGYVEIALHQLPATAPAHGSLEIVRSATDRAVELVHRILTFSRHQPSQRQPCMLRPVVEEVLGLLRATLPRMVEIEAEYAPEGFAVLADPTQVHQIIMNLGTNAAQAISGRGTIRLHLAPVVTDEPIIGVAVTGAPGSYMRLTISDDGCGMDSQTLSRIFDPFFTTKAPGSGTGLGLSVVLGIVKDHGGVLRVASEPGRGTRFEIYLPEATPAVESTRPPPSVAPRRGQGQRVLCVDDEPWLLALERTFLEDLGYEVLVCSNPADALRRIHELKPAVLVTDLAMSEMSGIELAAEVHRELPELPIILCSGHLQPEQRQQAREAGVRRIIAKPDILQPLARELGRIFG